MQQELVDTPFRVITFSEDHAGELYFVDFMNARFELVPAPKAEPVAPFPRKLSETGCSPDEGPRSPRASFPIQ